MPILVAIAAIGIAIVIAIPVCAYLIKRPTCEVFEERVVPLWNGPYVLAKVCVD